MAPKYFVFIANDKFVAATTHVHQQFQRIIERVGELYSFVYQFRFAISIDNSDIDPCFFLCALHKVAAVGCSSQCRCAESKYFIYLILIGEFLHVTKALNTTFESRRNYLVVVDRFFSDSRGNLSGVNDAVFARRK